jgi:hypothetical protein
MGKVTNSFHFHNIIIFISGEKASNRVKRPCDIMVGKAPRNC